MLSLFSAPVMSLGSRQKVLNKMLPYLALIKLTLHYKRQTKFHEEKFETMKKKSSDKER